MEDLQINSRLIYMLLARLERISADSFWAHRASGVRGALFRHLDLLEKNQQGNDVQVLKLMEDGYKILELAAKEM